LENAAIPEGYVYATEPSPGSKVRPGSIINVYVSAGSEQILVPVPEFKGLPEREAKSLLDSLGLLVGNVTYTRSPKAAGTVLYASLEAGSNAYAYVSAIDFIVSGGEDFDINVCPEVIGKDKADAKAALEYYGIKVTLITVQSDAATGTVIAQSPDAATAIEANSSEVTLTVSGGPTYVQTVDMINFVGQTLTHAEAILDYMFEGICEYKITTVYTQSLKPRDTILAQTPNAGSVSVTSGVLEITFTLSGGPGFVPPPVEHTVPFIEGLTLSNAEAVLKLSGISIGQIYYVESGAPAGVVVLQSEEPYSVLLGQPGKVSIDVTVSLGSPDAPVIP
jgi:beta-lactam-binding protein with PASTA domain